MEEIKGGGRAYRYQRPARHARRVPGEGHRGNSLTRREAQEATIGTVALMVLVTLAILVCGLVGGPAEGAELAEHARWERQLKEDGAWVMW